MNSTGTMQIDERSKVPYYLQVKDLIIAMLRDGRIKAGERLPTVREFSKLFKVGLVTTNRAVTELKQEGVLCSRPRKGTFVSEQAAARLAQQTVAATIGIVLTASAFQRRNSFYLHEIFDGVAAGNRDASDMQILTVPSSPDGYGPFCDNLHRKGIEGLLLASRMPVQFVAELMNRKVPFVWINNDLAHERILSVMADDVQTMTLTLNHLKACGYRRVGMINYWWPSGTQAAYRDLLQDKGFDTDPELTRSGVGGALADEQRCAGAHARELMSLARPPEVLFLFGEGTLSGAYRAIRELKLDVPRDVGLIGCVQQTYAEHFPLPLTYTQYPNRAMAERAVHMLWQAIRGEPVDPEKTVMGPELVIGKTCREIPGGHTT